MRGRPSRLTEAARRRLDREAEIIAQHTPYKQLAAELGLTAKYVCNYVNARVRINVAKASNKEN